MSEYITIENNVITGLYCGAVDKNNENIVVLPAYHEVLVGDTLKHYNVDWTRKSKVELIKLGLEQVDEGYVLDGDTIREMNEVERIIAGLDDLPYFQKIVDNKLVEKTEEELWLEKSTDKKAEFIRSKRNNLIKEVDTILLKYQEQVELGIIQSKDSYRLALLNYKQELRDITNQETFPDNVTFPAIPKYEDYT